MQGKIVVITGASSGIGKATAMEIARMGSHVVLACRDLEKAESTRREIINETGNKSVESIVLNLASMDSIRKFYEKFQSSFDCLDILINNAGLFQREKALTAEGFEIHFGVMYLGHFLLTNLLISHLKNADLSRVVTVSAWGHRLAKLDFDNFKAEKNFKPIAAYCQSKLAQVLFTKELAERMKDSSVTAYSLHPGMVSTNLADELPPLMMSIFDWLLVSPQNGASTSIFLATAPNIENYSGQYFSYCTLLRSFKKKPAITSKLANDKDLAKKLWQVSAELCQLT